MNGAKLIAELRKHGFDAYYVGGCVRDKIMGKIPHDIDIATQAAPNDIMSVFSEYTVLPTGLKHGTVTVLDEGIPYEITTFRMDGNYSDGRHPDKVEFTSNIIEDLARRDFTINAVAMDCCGNIIDPFGGVNDIKSKLIRCVGVPGKRFSEDALRIMRAVRFASQLDFVIDTETSEAIHVMAENLNMISYERIRSELDKLICGRNSLNILMQYRDIINTVIPEFAECMGFDQHSDYHCYDVWEHIVRAISAAPTDDVLLRRSLLFHDIGKPRCAKFDENGKGHFKGHSEVSASMAEQIMKRLKYDSKSIRNTVLLIKYHSEKIKNKLDIKKMLFNIGENLFFKLLEMKKCDNSAKKSFVLKENAQFDKLAESARKIIDDGECYTYDQLAVNGNDLKKCGLERQEIGLMLKELLLQVMEENLNNDKNTLINYVKWRNGI